MNSTAKTDKTFNCVAMKRDAEARIYERIKDLKPEQEIAYFDHAVRTGPLAEFWRRLEEHHLRVRRK